MPGRVNGAYRNSPTEAAARFLARMPAGSLIAVALSGGGDSVGLLVALDEANKRMPHPMRLAAITVDHGLREGSAGEAQAMAAFCARRAIPHRIRRWEGEKPATGLLDAARQARYRLLVDAAEELGADCLVTAHTLDDQLETVEMRRSRSDTGARGLAGMAAGSLFFGRLWVYRPFLAVGRAEIRAYLSERGVAWFDDPSNEDPRFERVRLRQRGVFSIDIDEISAAGARRRVLGEAAAAQLLRGASSPLPMLFALSNPVDPADEALRLGLAALIATAGGQAHLPAEAAVGEALAGLGESNVSSVSLGRAVIEKRGGRIYIGRARRNLPVLTLAAGETGLWDARFMVRNVICATISIGPDMSGTSSEEAPPRIAKRAIATMPSLQAAPDPSGQNRVRVVATPYCAPFDTVLPAFDEALAKAIYRLMGRPTFTPSLAFLTEKIEQFS